MDVKQAESKYLMLYEALRDEIIRGVWPCGTPEKDAHATGQERGPGSAAGRLPAQALSSPLSSNFPKSYPIQDGYEEKPNISNVTPGEIPGMEPKK